MSTAAPHGEAASRSAAAPNGDAAAYGDAATAWRVPPLAAAIVSRLPQIVPSAAFAAALQVAARRFDAESIARLRGHVVRVVVRDAGLMLSARFAPARVVPAPARAPADVTIAASLADLYLLAARKEDPDTLFFARRLSLEGDTDVGLIVKNLLDATISGRFLRGSSAQATCSLRCAHGRQPRLVQSGTATRRNRTHARERDRVRPPGVAARGEVVTRLRRRAACERHRRRPGSPAPTAGPAHAKRRSEPSEPSANVTIRFTPNLPA